MRVPFRNKAPACVTSVRLKYHAAHLGSSKAVRETTLCLQFGEQRPFEKAARSNIFPIPAHSHWFRCRANCDLGIDLFTPSLWKTIQRAPGSSRWSCRSSVQSRCQRVLCRWKEAMRSPQGWTGSARHLWKQHMNFYKLSKVKGRFTK